MKNLKSILSELSLHELKELKANPYLIDEVIASKELKVNYDNKVTAKSFALEGSGARINIPPHTLINQKAIAEFILKQDGSMYKQLSEELKQDLTLLELAYRQNPYVLLEVDDSLIAQVFTITKEEIGFLILNSKTKEEILASLESFKKDIAYYQNPTLKLKIS